MEKEEMVYYEMKIENGLIAEFMGGIYFDIGMENKGYENLPIPPNRIIISDTCSKYIDELEYHKSWDWLMPVVDKIKILGETSYIPNIAGRVLKDIVPFSIITDKETIYKAVVKFIKWYNANLRNPE